MKIKELINLNRSIESKEKENNALLMQKEKITHEIDDLIRKKESIKRQIENLQSKKSLLIEKSKELQKENKKLQEKGKMQFQEELIQLLKENYHKDENEDYIDIKNCYIVKVENQIYFTHQEKDNYEDGPFFGVETRYYNVFNSHYVASTIKIESPPFYAGTQSVDPSGYSYIPICDYYPILKLYSDQKVPESIMKALYHDLVIENNKFLKSYVKKCRAVTKI